MNDNELTKYAKEFVTDIMSDNIYSQFNIIRYNSLDTIRRENLGEHHAAVTQLVVKIIERLSLENEIPDRTKYLAVAAAAYHDMGETVYGDQNYEVKRDNPELSEISNRIEKDYICSLKYLCPVFTEAQEDKLAHSIYKLADAIELLMFVRRERKLGNSDEYLDTIVCNGYALSERHIGNINKALAGMKKKLK